MIESLNNIVAALAVGSALAGCASAASPQEATTDSPDELEGLTDAHNGEPVTEKGYLWTDEPIWDSNTIAYELQDNLTDLTVSRLEGVIEHVHASTQITFVERTNQAQYLTIRDAGTGSCSWNINVRRITLSDSCTWANISHELGHALGLGHEQLRSDVDEHIYIEGEPGPDWGTGSGYHHGPFDIYSPMLSARPAWELDGTPVPTAWGLSTGAIRAINWLHGTQSPTTGIKADNNRWISSNNGSGSMAADRTTPQAWEEFEIYYLDNGNVAFKCNNGRWVSSENGTKLVTCNRTERQAWEQFFLRPRNTGYYSITCNNGKFLRRSGDSGLACIGEDGSTNRERFYIHRLDVDSP